MTTKLAQPIRREIEIDGETYTIVVTTQGVRLSRKRFRSGRLITWRNLWAMGEVEDGTPERASKYSMDD